jgi:glyoxylase-like metal-dependent hydrolase (beta-lactamase superfamily II)
MKSYRIRPLLLTIMEIDESILTYRYNMGVTIKSPVVAWYIEGADAHILVDTGADAALATSYRGFPAGKIMDFTQALVTLGLKPSDIDIVIQTHLHWDHCANTQKCASACVIVQEDELQFALAPHPISGLSYKKELLEGVNFRVIKGEYQVEPGIDLIPAPGHSPGSMAVAINTEKGKAVITGFCCVLDNFNPPEKIRAYSPVIPPGTHTDLMAGYTSMLKIKGIADILLCQHDMTVAQKKVIP